MKTGTGRFVQTVLLLNGVVYLATGLALLLAPEWFFANVGNFPPFNRHYEGDLGSFLLALGAGLLYALRYPAAQAGVLGVAAAGGTLHALNHAVDALRGAGGWDQTLSLSVVAALTLAAVWQVASRARAGAA
jgi:hypothetical protein